MKRKRHTPEQAVRKLREGEKRLNAGEELGSVLRQLEIAESTWNRWRSTDGGMKAADVKELKELRVARYRPQDRTFRRAGRRGCSGCRPSR